jgi:hypothetical protein
MTRPAHGASAPIENLLEGRAPSRPTPAAKPPPSLFLFFLLLLALPIQAQTRATLLEPVSVPIIQNGKTLGTGQVRAGTLVQILNRTEDTVEISTPLGPTKTLASNLLAIESEPATAPAENSAAPPAAEPPPQNPSPAIPARSSIRIQETLKKHNPTGRCRGNGETRTFTPILELGEDSRELETTFRLFVVFNAWIKKPKPNAAQKPEIKPSPGNPLGLEKLNRSDGEVETRASKQIDISVSPGQPIDKTANFGWFNWTCSCCRPLNPPVKPQLIGWHAELVSGDKILLASQSSKDPRITKAVDHLKANPTPEKPTPVKPHRQ